MRSVGQYIVVHRVQPVTQKGYLLVAHTAFSGGSKDRGLSELCVNHGSRANMAINSQSY